jgi:hypothetical protein
MAVRNLAADSDVCIGDGTKIRVPLEYVFKTST